MPMSEAQKARQALSGEAFGGEPTLGATPPCELLEAAQGVLEVATRMDDPSLVRDLAQKARDLLDRALR